MKKYLLSLILVSCLMSAATEMFSQATEKWYLRRTPPEPWTWAPILNTNITEMDNVFGVGVWNSGYYSTVDPLAVFADSTCFVFMEGGDDHALDMKAFLDANITTIENWVFNGGNLFINAAPNEGADINIGFGGCIINYPDYASNVNAVDPTHPIFIGPHVPVGTSWSGTYFGHASVSGPGLTPLIEDSFAGFSVCSEKAWGAGKIIAGGMTVTSWDSPSPQCINVRENIFEYLSSYVLLDFTYPDSVYCQFEADPAPVFAVGADTGIFISTPTGLVIDSITGIIDLSASAPGTYDVTNFMDGTSCASGSSTVTITVAGTPVADAGPDQFLCRGDSVQLDGSGGDTYLWLPPVYLDDATIEDPTVQAPPTNMFYQMVAYNTYGCPDTDEVSVFLYPDPVIDAGEDQVMVLGGFADLNATGGSSYSWTPTTSLSDPLIPNPIATPEDTTVYVVVGTDINGCVDTDSVTIFVIEESSIVTPNAFTPNGDGVNDSYKPTFVGLGQITDFTIYNRWGSLLYATEDPTLGWDGLYNGIEQEVGTYVVVIKGLNQFGDVVVKTTTLALLR